MPAAHPHLFSPLHLRDVTLPNRIAVSPMCQYCATNGQVDDWHFVHLATRAVGGAGLVFTEATAVLPEGRISPGDLGIWNDAQRDGLKRIVDFLHSQGAAAGIQLGHAGRKASMAAPWKPQRVVPPSEGGWTEILAPSALPFSDSYGLPVALDEGGIERIQDAFVEATRRSKEAGFQIVEIHAAHGYIFHQFLSPLSNRRTDRYGGSFTNRIRFLVETVDRVRHEWPASLPLLVRVSATDWLEHEPSSEGRSDSQGWTLSQTVELTDILRQHGVDLIDVSSGGNVAQSVIPVGPGYQTHFADVIRREAKISVGAVGMIDSPSQADHIIRSQQADIVLLARELLRDPYWPLRAARDLRHEIPWPAQYARAASSRPPLRTPFVIPTE